MIRLGEIVLARQLIAKYLLPTPLEEAPSLGENIWLKLENANKTHSFKIRGALNAILSLGQAECERGITAASSGNHAQAVAYAAHLAGIPARIIMPAHTPRRKVNGVRRYGAEAVLSAANYDEAEIESRRIEREEGLTLVSPYNDLKVIAGAGTIGLEIIETLPDVERVIVPVSGGGLIAGVAAALKELKPGIEVIGINAEAAPAMYNVFHQTTLPQIWDTLAEALSGEIEAGSVTLDIARRYVDNMFLVTETQIAAAMRWMIREQGWLAEGGGIVGIAALLHDILPIDGRKTVVVVSGGNVDVETLLPILHSES